MNPNSPKNCEHSNPLVSILIPCWGCERFIEETLRSALSQRYEPLEIVVVEDCGEDRTYDIAKGISDPRLSVYRNSRNLGQYGNKNEALRRSNGSHVVFLDGDDLLEPSCVERQMEIWRGIGPAVGVVFSRWYDIDEEGRMMYESCHWGYEGRALGREVLELYGKKRMSGSIFGNVTGHLFYRAALERAGGFPNDNSGPGDIEMYLRLLCHTDVYFLEDCLSRYRHVRISMSTRTFGLREASDYVRMVEKLGAYYADKEASPSFIHNEDYLRRWKVWSSSHIILASLMKKLRGRPNEYDAIAALYKSQGLETEFRQFLRRSFVRYLYQTFRSRFRRRLGMPMLPPLFRKGDFPSKRN